MLLFSYLPHLLDLCNQLKHHEQCLLSRDMSVLVYSVHILFSHQSLRHKLATYNNTLNLDIVVIH